MDKIDQMRSRMMEESNERLAEWAEEKEGRWVGRSTIGLPVVIAGEWGVALAFGFGQDYIECALGCLNMLQGGDTVPAPAPSDAPDIA